MIKGAIFDVDGTILDSMKIWDEVGQRYLSDRGKTAEKNLNDILFPMTIEEGAEYIENKYHISEERGQIAEGLLDIVKDFYFLEAEPKQGAVELLDLLDRKNIPMTVASSSNREHIERAFERLDIKKYFVEIFTCSEVGAGKTEPLIFEQAAKIMGSEPQMTYVFEDGFYAAETAKKAGFKVVGIYDDSSRADWENLRETADIAVEDLKEFNKIWEYISK